MNVDQIQVTQLVEMGFPQNACIKAVYFTKNAGIEEAMNWVMAHMDDLGRLLGVMFIWHTLELIRWQSRDHLTY